MRKRLLTALVLFAAVLSLAGAQSLKGWTMGLGKSPIFRVGPGKDSTGTQVYSFTYVYGTVVFDAKGKIVSCEFDELEVATPNYDGPSMPHFAGWPGTPGYNVTNHDTKTVSGTSPNTVESTMADVLGWKTKRERGADYGMNPKNEWFQQMDFYQKLFVGKTVDEVEAWFKKYTSDKTGRPLFGETKDAAEKAKFDALSKADQKIAVDARSGATMSISDAHGNVLAALRDAWNKRKPMTK
jgi:hypothetical protein